MTNLLLLAVGLILLVKGSDFFIKAAAFVAKRFGVSEFIKCAPFLVVCPENYRVEHRA